MKKNFYLDVILFVSGLICIATGIMLDFHLLPHGDFSVRHIVRNFHIYSGYVMAIGLIFHLIWHSGWINAATKQIFKKKQENSHE